MVLGHSHAAQRVPLAFARGGEHLEAQVRGQMHRGRADAAAGAVHQHPFPGRRGGLPQGVQGGDVGDRRRRGLRHRPSRGYRGQQCRVGVDGVGDRVDQTEHRVTGRESGHVGRDGAHHARRLVHQPPRRARHGGQPGQCHRERQPGRPQCHPHRARREFGRRCGTRHQGDVVQVAGAGDVQSPVSGQPRARGRRRVQPGAEKTAVASWSRVTPAPSRSSCRMRS
ncbi:Uncharacterised protein [Mycobacteroides abscessus subsp. abscessus]|nr:Uncharacterised protein [Mycobacteroides abscessus subsp. abscessus]